MRLGKKLAAMAMACVLAVGMATSAFAAEPPYSTRVVIYNVQNAAPNLNAACSTSPVNHTNVTMWQTTSSDTQRWELKPIDLTKHLYYIRNYANLNYALNIYPPNNNNCDLLLISSNSPDDCTIKCVDEGKNNFGIVLPAYVLALTPTGFSNGSNVNWQAPTGNLNQLWSIRTSA